VVQFYVSPPVQFFMSPDTIVECFLFPWR
jgi:hypothetical protein